MHARLVLLLAVPTALLAQTGPVNPDFEKGSPGSVPDGWFVPAAFTGYDASWTTEGCHQGKACAQIVPKANPGAAPGNLMQMFDAGPYRGKLIRYRAAVNVENGGRAGLWLRVDRPGGVMGFFDNMQARPIVTAGTWQYFDIDGFVHADAEKIALGILVYGTKAHFDDVTLEITGEIPVTIDERARPLTETGLRNLTALTKAFGIVRHFHPSDEAASVDWNRFAIDAVRRVESANSANELAAALQAVPGIGRRGLHKSLTTGRTLAAGVCSLADRCATIGGVKSAYGSWKSPITSDLIVAQSIGLSEVRMDGNDVYWLESRPEERGRSVVVRWANGRAGDVLPAPFNARTRVHEYGGGAWTVAEGTLYFSHDADRRLYRLDPGGEPVPLTPAHDFRYGDGVIDGRRRRWIGVREDHSAAGQEPVNTIVSVETGGAAMENEWVLTAGHDFFSSPRLSPDGRRLAYLAWDHPRMPWDGTTLYVQALNETGEPVEIAGGPCESVFQPEWAPDGSALYFVSDRSGWWNLYRREIAAPETRVLAPMEAEFGQPQWVLGMSTYALVDDGRLVCSYVSNGLGKLAVVNTNSGELADIDTPYTEFSSVRAVGDAVVFRAGSAVSPAAIVHIDLSLGRSEVLRKATRVADDEGVRKYFTRVEQLEFPTEGNRTAFGLFYPAFNPDYTAAEDDVAEDEKPPLVVKCHGGPTSAASSTLDLRIQFWTSRGISVLDVNYGGSSGYGRAYRERLAAPVIFFQGDEDQVVPPNQTELMVEALRAKGTPVGYLLFAGEQHGFRKAESIKRALDAELYFYAVTVFG